MQIPISRASALEITPFHIFVSGYDISTVNGIKSYMNKFDSLIGIKHITNFHINDSRYMLGSRKDEHRGIGKGHIYSNDKHNDKHNENTNSKKALKYIKTLCMKHKIPMILETHGAGKHSSHSSHSSHSPITGYEYEIAMIKKL